ncbi:hypothetical protein [Actinokineospora sp.]|uniref:hypothetical protein n=1 Tax=Actinokineospora sp. TaxID=1872133 RepID=UPI004037AD05
MNDCDQLDAAKALQVVGLALQDVLDLGGSVLTAGRAFLVGSLAGGLGNRGSDVDIHLLMPGISKPSPAFLFFAGETPIDIEHYPATMPADLLAGARAFPVRELPIGVVSLAPPPGRRTRRTAARWLNSVPLHADQPPVFDAAESAALLPTLVRASIDQLVQVWAMARLAERGGEPEAARYLCGRAGRELLELRCRARGDVLTSEKWLPNRAARLGLDTGFVRGHYAASTEAELVALLAGTGLAEWDPWQLTAVRPDPDRTATKLGREEFVLTRHGRLIRDAVTAEGSLAGIAGEHSAGRLMRGIRDAELVLDVAAETLREALDD